MDKKVKTFGDGVIQAYLFHSTVSKGPAPLVWIVTGLDHYRTFATETATRLVSLGYSVLIHEMPGTGDCPIEGKEIEADVALWSSVLDWVYGQPAKFDTKKVIAWGLSAGSYWIVKASRRESKRLRSVVSQGTFSHYAFKRDWLRAVDFLEYPVDLWRPLARSFGYTDKNEFADHALNYSLVNQGIIDQPAAPLLAVNGLDDTVFPIDDQIVLLTHGMGAAARWFPKQGHMGEPPATEFLFNFFKAQASLP
ncbi:alpha/beta-hydrolase [Violaceomyces palustris]|uniref:Alpha/beta-hydrolase n=1 Tax=Violaceomyces palustris TaxID=1673888 RepID=A0ACD0NX29_9BASI|nr:alpha/beta-hydrolase [Violaceomyces palustris]